MPQEKIPRRFVENLMFGTGRVRRFTQDSPVLPDVWLAFAGALEDDSVVPSRHGAVHLLLTPYRDTPPGKVRNAVAEMVETTAKAGRARFGHDDRSLPVIYNQTTVSAELYFEDLIRAVLPLTAWWRTLATRIGQLADKETRRLLSLAIQNPENPSLHFAASDSESSAGKKVLALPPDVFWLVRVVGAMTLILSVNAKGARAALPPLFDDTLTPERRTRQWRKVVDAVAALVADIPPSTAQSLIYTASLNRAASISVNRSTLAIKADAARHLFNISCRDIRWAVIDSGIDARHPAFRVVAGEEPFVDANGRAKNNTRVLATYDFSVVHRLLNKNEPEIPERIRLLASQQTEEGERARRLIERLQTMLAEGDAIDWRIVGPLLEVAHDEGYTPPPATLDHGTHVAGILGGSWTHTDDRDTTFELRGVCPDIRLYDIRVISAKGVGGEFAIMSAMQFVRWLNSTHATQGVHGTNLSLSIRHDISNYACGRTPVCEEAERLVAAGVVVVTAAGNYGHRRYSTPDGTAEAYNSISIVDPGNADAVITVGATHRFKPHTYGVSYFSSRGPTGDGRVKPDLVAPGEKITSSVRDDGIGVKDGTSMAAPHVSGAAALLMARHQELIGNPSRIKKILCETATDLGRERYFQGHGMLDVLRALQAV